MNRIYLALPYTHKLRSVRKDRIHRARQIVKLLILYGTIVICPVLQTHGLGLPTDWKFWERYDLTFLKWCDELWVIKLYNWEKSEGVRSEILTAKTMGKRIVYLEPEWGQYG